MSGHIAENDAPRWEVRHGDRFLPYAVTIWMNEHDHGFNYRVLDHAATTLPRAIKRGLAMNGSDDFNIAVIRHGRMVAALWMEQIVDDDSVVIDGIADALGLPCPVPPGDRAPRNYAEQRALLDDSLRNIPPERTCLCGSGEVPGRGGCSECR